MTKSLFTGAEFFDELIRENGYYVDKTEMIYKLVKETTNKVTLFTRPRRFGKTLMMTMLESFFDCRRDSRDVFESLDVYKNHPEFCAEWMNQYPTLFITMKDVEGLSFEKAYAKLKAVIAEICTRHSYLEENQGIYPNDAVVFSKLASKTGSEEETQNALKTIMRMMHAVHGKPVVLIIDEYDVPLAKAQANGYYRQMLEVIRGLMSSALKTNEHLKFAFITGCLRISKESIFTGVNNFACYSVTVDDFSPSFGFTPAEVQKMLEEFGIPEKYEVIREWYDGYLFGNTEVFCPWDVINYISSVLRNRQAKPRNYWANTSSNAILNEFVNHGKIDASDKFETLLNGGSFIQEISDEMTYDQLAESEKNFWSVLLMTGYVSKANADDDYPMVRLRIPNREIATLFKEAVVERFNRRLDTSLADTFINALWNKDPETASAALSDILWNSISYFDYSEDYYHGMMNGIFTSRGYNLDSNDEAGLGRLDLRVKDRQGRRILLMEFKRVKADLDLSAGCDEAIQQIEENGYAKLKPEGYRQQIVYGIAFYGKKAMIRLAEHLTE